MLAPGMSGKSLCQCQSVRPNRIHNTFQSQVYNVFSYFEIPSAAVYVFVRPFHVLTINVHVVEATNVYAFSVDKFYYTKKGYKFCRSAVYI